MMDSKSFSSTLTGAAIAANQTLNAFSNHNENNSNGNNSIGNKTDNTMMSKCKYILKVHAPHIVLSVVIGFLAGYTFAHCYKQYVRSNTSFAEDDTINNSSHTNCRQLSETELKQVRDHLNVLKKKNKQSGFDLYKCKKSKLTELKIQLSTYTKCKKRRLLLFANESRHTYQVIRDFVNEQLNINHSNHEKEKKLSNELHGTNTNDDNDDAHTNSNIDSAVDIRKPKLLLIPFGHNDWNEYFQHMSQKMWELGFTLKSIQCKTNFIKLFEECDAILISGGNTYKLLYYLYAYDMLSVLKTYIDKYEKLYIGIDCGLSVACLTVQLCNHLPIIQPPTMKGLSLVPFQICPNFIATSTKLKGTEKEKQEENKHSNSSGDGDVLGNHLPVITTEIKQYLLENCQQIPMPTCTTKTTTTTKTGDNGTETGKVPPQAQQFRDLRMNRVLGLYTDCYLSIVNNRVQIGGYPNVANCFEYHEESGAVLFDVKYRPRKGNKVQNNTTTASASSSVVMNDHDDRSVSGIEYEKIPIGGAKSSLMFTY